MGELGRAASHVLYAVLIPKFWINQKIIGMYFVMECALFTGAMFAPSIPSCAVLLSIDYVLDMASRSWSCLLPIVDRFMIHKSKRTIPVAAQTAEHHAERNAAFVVIVLGEMVVNVLYNAATYDECGLFHILTGLVCYGNRFRTRVLVLVLHERSWYSKACSTSE